MKQDNQQQPTSAEPIGYESKARNVFGSFNMWAQNMPFISFFMFILGWFTVPVEILFRKNFGERWLTIVNFYAGLLVLVIFTTFQTAGAGFSASNSYYHQRPGDTQATGPSFIDSIMDKSMLIILLVYLALSSYHFFKMWWRNRTNTPLFSYHDGVSRFETVAVYIMKLVNIIAVPMIRFYIRLLPKAEQKLSMEIPPLIEDVTAFTNTVFEPLLLLILFFFFHGILATWLLISSLALAIYANWKQTAKLDYLLDMRDNMILATDMSERRRKPMNQQATTAQNMIMQQVAEMAEQKPELIAYVKPTYPDLMDIIAEVNGEKEDAAVES